MGGFLSVVGIKSLSEIGILLNLIRISKMRWLINNLITFLVHSIMLLHEILLLVIIFIAFCGLLIIAHVRISLRRLLIIHLLRHHFLLLFVRGHELFCRQIHCNMRLRCVLRIV